MVEWKWKEKVIGWMLKRREGEYVGGRGSSSGISDKHHKYGSQFHAIIDTNGKPLVSGNIKFVESNSKLRQMKRAKGRVICFKVIKQIMRL